VEVPKGMEHFVEEFDVEFDVMPLDSEFPIDFNFTNLMEANTMEHGLNTNPVIVPSNESTLPSDDTVSSIVPTTFEEKLAILCHDFLTKVHKLQLEHQKLPDCQQLPEVNQIYVWPYSIEFRVVDVEKG
jgi:hypothetical protein